ncbi:MAG: HAMP domain-containing histidine kinase [Muribaculaceae bacterium]|nr:HAMP domain-containing histidine kinase [Muribaculaceae bacterium]
MVSKKKRINYQLKLWLPIACLLWGVILVVEISQYNKEKEYRTEMIRSRIDFMNQRLLDMMERGLDPSTFLDFIDEYYDASELDNLSMTLYDTETWNEESRVGFPTPSPEQLGTRGKIDGAFISANNNDDSVTIDPNKAFYYSVNESKDGRYMVQTFLPVNAKLTAQIKGNPGMRIFVLAACLAITIVTYIAARHMTKNIRLLREFVSNAANDHDFVAVDKFANDDLGEISRQVINIYNTRKAALAARELEHRVALKATEERSTLKRQLTNNISHELKTPAGIIKGYIDTIMENPEMDEDSRRHFLLKTQENVERLCNILNDLSTMTRLEDGAKNIELEKIDFKEFVNQLATDIDESGIIGDMVFTTSIPDKCYVKGNHSLLLGAIMNLVKNSAAYSKGTQMSLRIVTENHRFYTFKFSDNGVGVPEESIPMLFDRFYRVDKGRSRKAGGTGLGLSIVRSSLNTIGGSISVNNGEEGGLEFVFTLRKWHDNPDKGTAGKDVTEQNNPDQDLPDIKDNEENS